MRRWCALLVVLPVLVACTPNSAPTPSSRESSIQPVAATTAAPDPAQGKWRGMISMNSKPLAPPNNWSKSITVNGDSMVVTETGWEGPNKPKNISDTKKLSTEQAEAISSAMTQLSTITPQPAFGGESATIDMTDGTRKVSFVVPSLDPNYSKVKALYETLSK